MKRFGRLTHNYDQQDDARHRRFALSALCFFTSLICLIYVEPLAVGGVKIGQIWKGLLISVLLFLLLRGRQIRYSPGLLLVFLAMLQFLQLAKDDNFSLALSSGLVFLLIGLLGLVVSQARDARKLEVGIVSCSYVVVLCFIPFQLGLVSSLVGGYDLYEQYGLDRSGLLGPFQSPQGASFVAACASVVLLADSVSNKSWISLVVAGCGGVVVFQTLSRTGMLSLSVAIFFIFFRVRRDLGRRQLVILSFLIAAIIIVALYTLELELVRARILGERLRQSEFDHWEYMGSGRLGIWAAAIEVYLGANLNELLFGMGEAEMKSRIGAVWGNPLIPHNGVLHVLLSNGAVGLVIFITFVISCFRFASMSLPAGELKVVSIAALPLLSAWMSFVLVQGPIGMYGSAICMAAISSRRYVKVRV